MSVDEYLGWTSVRRMRRRLTRGAWHWAVAWYTPGVGVPRIQRGDCRTRRAAERGVAGVLAGGNR